MGQWQDLVELRSARSSWFELHGSWAGQVTGCGNPGFYLVEQGQLRVGIQGVSYQLDAGDLLLLPRSTDHVLGAGATSPIEPIEQLTARAVSHGELCVVGSGDGGLRVRSVAFVGRPWQLAWLPPALPLRWAERGAGWRHLVPALWEELRGERREALCSLSQAVFIKALADAARTACWDAQVLEVVARARQAPLEFASVAELARAVGLSSSRFSERFSSALGEPPMRWLRRMRMLHARAELAAGRWSVAQVAERCGYASESAFRKAYRRTLAEPPRARGSVEDGRVVRAARR